MKVLVRMKVINMFSPPYDYLDDLTGCQDLRSNVHMENVILYIHIIITI